MRDKITLLLIGLIASIFVIMGGFYAYSAFFYERSVSTPDLSVMTVDEMNTWANENNITIEYEYVYDDLIERGSYISQSHSANSEIKVNDIIVVKISSGADPNKIIQLPDFTGYTLEQIEEFVEKEKLSDVTYDYISDNKIEEDYFIKHNISTSTMKRSDMIIFTISSGKEAETTKEIIVPDFSFYSKVKIDNWGTQNNVYIKYAYKTSTTIEKGKVISQSVAVNSIIYPKKTITITLSSGEPITAIDLTNKSKTEVITWLGSIDNRINVSYEEKYHSTVTKNYVIKNSPNSGYIADGSTMTVVLSLGKPYLDNYQNKDYSELEKAVNNMNKKGAELTLSKTEEYHDTVKKGKIITSTSGEVSIGSTITVKISKGKQIIMTDFTNKAESELKAFCSDNGLVAEKKEEKYSSVTKGYIISNSPNSGSVLQGSKVEYVLSLGTFTPENVVGKSYDYAKSMIDTANSKGAGNWTIVKTEEYDNTTNKAKGLIFKQEVNGTELKVYVSKGQSFIVGNYIGMNKNAISSVNGVTFNFVEGEHSETIPLGQITNQSISSGTEVEKPVTITLTYSKGESEKAILKPYRSIYTAAANPQEVKQTIESELSAAGFTNFTVVLEANNNGYSPSGVVWEQKLTGTLPLNTEIIIKIQP